LGEIENIQENPQSAVDRVISDFATIVFFLAFLVSFGSTFYFLLFEHDPTKMMFSSTLTVGTFVFFIVWNSLKRARMKATSLTEIGNLIPKLYMKKDQKENEKD